MPASETEITNPISVSMSSNKIIISELKYSAQNGAKHFFLRKFKDGSSIH
jgi:hypothetical protein